MPVSATPNLADKSWVTDQYDRYVQGNSIQSQPDDSGMVRIDEKTHLGVAVATDANANWSYLNPYEGAKLALAEAARNIATAGAKPLADSVAAVSVGIIDGVPMLDLCYEEDVRAETDMNVVCSGDGRFIEVQGTAEGAPFDRALLDSLLDLAVAGTRTLTELQKKALNA